MPVAKSPSRREIASQARREAILEAGLDVFAERGFAACRLEDVAAKAGVAKGTIYLFCRDKEDLFEQIVLNATGPLLGNIGAVASDLDLPARVLFERLFRLFVTEALGTRRKLVLRLVLTEGARFPRIAEFYYRETVSKMIGFVRALAARAYARGELTSKAYADFPHLVVAPMIMAMTWDNLFSALAPLDTEAMLAAHLRALFGPAKGETP